MGKKSDQNRRIQWCKTVHFSSSSFIPRKKIKNKRQGKQSMHRDLHKNQSFNNLHCTEIVYALEREEHHDMYVPYWFYCSKAPKGAQVMITIIQSENNIWDRKWQKGEKIKQKAHREKDTVAPQQIKISSREEQFERNTVNYLLHFTEVLTWKYHNKTML